MRDGKFAIFARCAEGDRWHKTIYVGESKADEWNPVICSDTKEDRVWVAWDSYQSGAYNVQLRSLSGGPEPKLGDELQPPENSPRFQAHPSLACDGEGRLWVAWDEAGPNWGKDYGFLYFKAGGERLYASRAVRIRCLIDGQWKEPEADLYSAIPDDMKEFDELPQLQNDGDGHVWLAFRHRTCRHPRIDGWSIQGRWDMFATAWMGDRWTTPVELQQSGGRNDMRSQFPARQVGKRLLRLRQRQPRLDAAQHDRPQPQRRRQPARRPASTGRGEVPRPTAPLLRSRRSTLMRPNRSPASAATRSIREARRTTSIAATCTATPTSPATASATAP